jgi:hypothetical protein
MVHAVERASILNTSRKRLNHTMRICRSQRLEGIGSSPGRGIHLQACFWPAGNGTAPLDRVHAAPAKSLPPAIPFPPGALQRKRSRPSPPPFLPPGEKECYGCMAGGGSGRGGGAARQNPERDVPVRDQVRRENGAKVGVEGVRREQEPEGPDAGRPPAVPAPVLGGELGRHLARPRHSRVAGVEGGRPHGPAAGGSPTWPSHSPLAKGRAARSVSTTTGEGDTTHAHALRGEIRGPSCPRRHAPERRGHGDDRPGQPPPAAPLRRRGAGLPAGEGRRGHGAAQRPLGPGLVDSVPRGPGPLCSQNLSGLGLGARC